HEDGKLGQFGPELVGNLAPLSPGGFGIVLGKSGGNEGGDDAPAALAGMGLDVAHEVNAATLPGSVEHLADGGFDRLMRIRDHQLDATQSAPGQLAQECGPECLGFGGANVHAEYFASAITVDADRDN